MVSCNEVIHTKLSATQCTWPFAEPTFLPTCPCNRPPTLNQPRANLKHTSSARFHLLRVHQPCLLFVFYLLQSNMYTSISRRGSAISLFPWYQFTALMCVKRFEYRRFNGELKPIGFVAAAFNCITTLVQSSALFPSSTAVIKSNFHGHTPTPPLSQQLEFARTRTHTQNTNTPSISRLFGYNPKLLRELSTPEASTIPPCLPPSSPSRL